MPAAASFLPNLITACWCCQFGRGAWTIEELGLEYPRARAPVVDSWDGLGRLLGPAALAVAIGQSLDEKPDDVMVTEDQRIPDGTDGETRMLSSSQASWLPILDQIQFPPSRRMLDFLHGCTDLGVSWSIGKVLLARMRVGPANVEFMAIEPNGDVHLPWLVGGHKDAYRKFADILATGLPGAICYETSKLWNVSMPGKRRVGLVECWVRFLLSGMHSRRFTLNSPSR